MSARSQHTDMHDFFLPVRAAAEDSPAAGARADYSALCVLQWTNLS